MIITGDKFVDWAITAFFTLDPDFWVMDLLTRIFCTICILVMLIGFLSATVFRTTPWPNQDGESAI